jgi:hypothetical protein
MEPYLDYLFPTMGIIILIVEFIILMQRRSFRNRAVRVQGRVVDVVFDGEYYYPVIEFQTKKGETYRITSDVGSYPSYRRKGDTITVYYDPKNPEHFINETGCAGFLFIAIVSLIGLAFITIGIFLNT